MPPHVRNTVFNGVQTDTDGKFEITTSLKSKLTLEISMVGYKPTGILIESDKNVNVGTVYLEERIMLDEVQVNANSMIDVKGRTVIFLLALM